MNKRYFWIKVQVDFFDSDEMDWIHEQPNGAEYIYIYLRLCLLAINNGGVIERRIGKYIIPYEVKKLAELVKSSTDSVAIALSIFKKIGLVEETETGAIFIPGFEDMIGSETASTVRSRKSRALKKLKSAEALQCNDSVLQCNKNASENATTDIEIDTDTEKELDKKKKPKTRRFSAHDAIDSLVCGQPLKDALHAWVDMRKDDLKKPVGKQALKIGLNRLRELCGHDEAAMVEVVNQSTFKDWAGFFPLKDKKGPASSEADRREEVRKAVEKGSW